MKTKNNINLLKWGNQQSQYERGIKCLFFSYIPLFLFFALFQIFVENEIAYHSGSLCKQSSSVLYLVLYIGFGATHIIISILVTIHFLKFVRPKTRELKNQLALVLIAIIPINTLPVILNNLVC